MFRGRSQESLVGKKISKINIDARGSNLISGKTASQSLISGASKIDSQVQSNEPEEVRAGRTLGNKAVNKAGGKVVGTTAKGTGKVVSTVSKGLYRGGRVLVGLPAKSARVRRREAQRKAARQAANGRGSGNIFAFGKNGKSSAQTVKSVYRGSPSKVRATMNVARVAVATVRTMVGAVASVAGSMMPILLGVVVTLAVVAVVVSLIPSWLLNILDNDRSVNGVPQEYQAAVMEAGSICTGITPPIIAGLIEAESSWNKNVVSSVGAVGLTQFMPGTWATYGKEYKSTTTPGDITNTNDQIWSAGLYLCDLWAQMDGLKTSGLAEGDTLTLTLAAYNAGPGAVQMYGGVPPYKETQDYVVKIPQLAEKYAAFGGILAGGSAGPASSNAIVQEARKYLGVPYVWGGETPGGLDCSGLVTVVFRAFGIEVPHHAATAGMSSQGQLIPQGQWQPGDVLYFSYGPALPHHTSIYSGKKDGVDYHIEAVWYDQPLREAPVPTNMRVFAKRYHTDTGN